jgi:phage terminase large subunit-like protein
MSVAESTDLQDLAQRDPLAHPAVTSIRCFEFSTPPGDHLLETYTSLWRAADEDFPHAPTRVARLMPRGHGKTEGVAVVFPTWCVLTRPDVRVAVVSKTKGLAAERTEKIINAVERWGEHFGVRIADASKQELTTESGRRHKEPTVSAWGLESNVTGRHFDVIVYDDIVDWDNQRTETQRRNVRNYFRDYVDNLPSNDSVLPNGAVQALIGTRKHIDDIYATDILDSRTWDTDVYRAVHPDDWQVIESRDWQIRGSDGDLYADLAQMPESVDIANNGVVPNQDIRVLWPDVKPAESICYDIVDGDESSLVWQRENQQDPDAMTGQVFTSEMLYYVDTLPTNDDGTPKPLTWVAGLDLAQVDDPQKAAEGDGDYFALAVIGIDHDGETAYLDHLARKRGLSTKGAKEWVVKHIDGTAQSSPGYTLQQLLVEQNAGRGVGQRLQSDTHIPAKNVSSSGSKEQRLHNLSADFEGRELLIHGDPKRDPWRTFEQSEWLPFPTGAHDDMLDAVELAMRAVEFGEGTTTARIGGEGADSGESTGGGLDALVSEQARRRENRWK